MKYLDNSGLAAYDARLKEWVSGRAVKLPMTIIENSLNYDIGRDVTSELSFDSLLNIVTRCIDEKCIVSFDKSSGARGVIVGFPVCYSASVDSGTNDIMFWFELIAHIGGVVNLITMCYNGDDSTGTVTLSEKNIKTI